MAAAPEVTGEPLFLGALPVEVMALFVPVTTRAGRPVAAKPQFRRLEADRMGLAIAEYDAAR